MFLPQVSHPPRRSHRPAKGPCDKQLGIDLTRYLGTSKKRHLVIPVRTPMTPSPPPESSDAKSERHKHLPHQATLERRRPSRGSGPSEIRPAAIVYRRGMPSCGDPDPSSQRAWRTQDDLSSEPTLSACLFLFDWGVMCFDRVLGRGLNYRYPVGVRVSLFSYSCK